MTAKMSWFCYFYYTTKTLYSDLIHRFIFICILCVDFSELDLTFDYLRIKIVMPNVRDSLTFYDCINLHFIV